MVQHIAYTRTVSIGPIRDEFMNVYLEKKNMNFSEFVQNCIDKEMTKEGSMKGD